MNGSTVASFADFWCAMGNKKQSSLIEIVRRVTTQICTRNFPYYSLAPWKECVRSRIEQRYITNSSQLYADIETKLYSYVGCCAEILGRLHSGLNESNKRKAVDFVGKARHICSHNNEYFIYTAPADFLQCELNECVQLINM